MTLIDVGSEAKFRTGGNWNTNGQTDIGFANPANASGFIYSVEVYAGGDISAGEIGIFFNVASNNYSTRDNELVGTIVEDSKQTFTVELEIEAGDIIGIVGTSGGVVRDVSGGSGTAWKTGDYIPCTNETFSPVPSWDISLYGSGDDTPLEVAGNAIFFGMNF